MWAAVPRRRAPERGAKRTVARFAWFHTRVDEEEDPPVKVWLEWFYEYQEFDYSGYGGDRWATIARYSAVPV